ncbi:ATPase, F0 complex, subunit G, mitochondrial [Tanacetum coccineum]
MSTEQQTGVGKVTRKRDPSFLSLGKLNNNIPNRTESFWRELDFVKHSLKNFRTEMPIERVGVAALFGLECFLWFWAAEIAGRGFTVTGYDV